LRGINQNPSHPSTVRQPRDRPQESLIRVRSRYVGTLHVRYTGGGGRRRPVAAAERWQRRQPRECNPALSQQRRSTATATPQSLVDRSKASLALATRTYVPRVGLARRPTTGISYRPIVFTGRHSGAESTD
jgi:hypothetical protein